MEEGHIWDKVKNKGIDPREVTITSNTKYYFKCRKCKHSIMTRSNSAGKGALKDHMLLHPKKVLFYVTTELLREI